MNDICIKKTNLSGIRASIESKVCRVEWNGSEGSLYKSRRIYDVTATRESQRYKNVLLILVAVIREFDRRHVDVINWHPVVLHGNSSELWVVRCDRDLAVPSPPGEPTSAGTEPIPKLCQQAAEEEQQHGRPLRQVVEGTIGSRGWVYHQ